MKEIKDGDLELASGGGVLSGGSCEQFEGKDSSPNYAKLPKQMRVCALCKHFTQTGRIGGQCDSGVRE